MNSIKIALTITALSINFAAPGCGRSETTEERAAPVLRVPALTAAHNAFLQGDYLTMVKRVKEVLDDKNADPMAKDNARELLEKAYEVTNGKLPADWTLPAGFEPIGYKEVRQEVSDGPRLRVRLDGRVDDPKRMKGLALLRGTEVLLDSQANVGRYFASPPDPDGMVYFSLETRDVPKLPEPGIMTLRVALADGSVTEGWFIADRLASSASPVVTEPGESVSVKSANPTVKWLPFRSPEGAPYERRNLVLWLSRRNDDGTYANAWSSSSPAADRTEARLGGPGGLTDGDYSLDVVFDESRRFGPMSLVRRSTRVQSFHVTR